MKDLKAKEIRNLINNRKVSLNIYDFPGIHFLSPHGGAMLLILTLENSEHLRWPGLGSDERDGIYTYLTCSELEVQG